MGLCQSGDWFDSSCDVEDVVFLRFWVRAVTTDYSSTWTCFLGVLTDPGWVAHDSISLWNLVGIFLFIIYIYMIFWWFGLWLPLYNLQESETYAAIIIPKRDSEDVILIFNSTTDFKHWNPFVRLIILISVCFTDLMLMSDIWNLFYRSLDFKLRKY